MGGNNPNDPYGLSTGGASRYGGFDNVNQLPPGGYPDIGPKEYIMSALSAVGSRRGLIPSILSGLGQAYISSKQGQAANAANEQAEASRRGNQQALLEYLGVSPEEASNLSGIDKSLLDEVMKATQGKAATNYTNQVLPTIDAPTMEGAPSEEYQKSVLNNLMNLYRDRPEMAQTLLENQLKEATLESDIGAKQAQNQADIQYAVPKAGAQLQSTQLGNQKKNIEAQYLPTHLQDRQTIEGAKAGQAQQGVEEVHTLNAFDKVLKKMDVSNPDPRVFRGMAMEVLKSTPGISIKGQEAALNQIDNMAIMKMQINETNQLKSPDGGQSKGGLGINWGG